MRLAAALLAAVMTAGCGISGPTPSPALLFSVFRDGNPVDRATAASLTEELARRAEQIDATGLSIALDAEGRLRVEADGPTAAAAYARLMNDPGDVVAVGLPAGDGDLPAAIPPGAAQLFASRDVDPGSVRWAVDEHAGLSLSLALEPEATGRLADWTGANVGAQILIAVAGRPLVSAVVVSSIRDGQVQLSLVERAEAATLATALTFGDGGFALVPAEP